MSNKSVIKLLQKTLDSGIKRSVSFRLFLKHYDARMESKQKQDDKIHKIKAGSREESEVAGFLVFSK